MGGERVIAFCAYVLLLSHLSQVFLANPIIAGNENCHIQDNS